MRVEGSSCFVARLAEMEGERGGVEGVREKGAVFDGYV